MGDVNPPVRVAIGRLGNSATDRNLKFIDELHQLGASKYIDLPQVSL